MESHSLPATHIRTIPAFTPQLQGFTSCPLKEVSLYGLAGCSLHGLTN